MEEEEKKHTRRQSRLLLELRREICVMNPRVIQSPRLIGGRRRLIGQEGHGGHLCYHAGSVRHTLYTLVRVQSASHGGSHVSTLKQSQSAHNSAPWFDFPTVGPGYHVNTCRVNAADYRLLGYYLPAIPRGADDMRSGSRRHCPSCP